MAAASPREQFSTDSRKTEEQDAPSFEVSLVLLDVSDVAESDDFLFLNSLDHPLEELLVLLVLTSLAVLTVVLAGSELVEAIVVEVGTGVSRS